MPARQLAGDVLRVTGTDLDRFLDMRRVIVEALTSSSGAGLTWLGDNTIASGRDIMHFDLRGAGPIKKIVKSDLGTTTGLGGD